MSNTTEINERDLVLLQVRIPRELKREAQRALVGRGSLQRLLYRVVVRELAKAVESGKSEGSKPRAASARKSA